MKSQKNDIEEPEDLGIKIGTLEEIFWTDVKRKCEENLTTSKHEIIIQEAILKLAEERIKEESK